jgi:glycosyltransferase involved in cell wall biosynthesis
MIKSTARIVHLIEGLGSGGAERFLYTILKHLDRSRFEAEVITVFSSATHWKGPIEALGVKVTSLDCRRLRDWPKGVQRLRRHLRNSRPDLIHTNLWIANVIGRIAGKMSGIPVISSIHSPDHSPDAWRYALPVSPLKRWPIWLLDRWTAQFGGERLLAVSEHVRRNAHERLGFPLERIDLLYNPVDIDQFQSGDSSRRQKLLEELRLPEGSFILLNVARVLPLKGLQYAIRALPAVREKYPGAHLVSVGAVGDQRWLSILEAEAASLGVGRYIRFLGERRDIPDLLRCCDLFVFPSLYEGLGISLIEAMASGRACVASRTGPIPEAIRHGVDGWLAPPADDRALADAICTLLADEDKRKRLGEAAAESVRARFHPTTTAGTLEGIYKSVLDKASSAAKRSCQS